MTTPYHSAYWAHALTLRAPAGTVERIATTMAGARVELNPHQVDAALFAVQSPFSHGVILADEVGLGKTIEAGIVIAQRLAERAGRLLIIVPATLRKQWQQELHDKFGVAATILGNKIADDEVALASLTTRVVICSYQYAANRQQMLSATPWGLVVIDEAHRLRNVYKTGSKTARAIADLTAGIPKVLLTATPLQNSLMELYGLVSIIDPHIFGDAASFREQFVQTDDEDRFAQLRRRLAPICKRTLRKQVLEYVPFTKRISITQDFTSTAEEEDLYQKVSTYLQRDTLEALPVSQRSLITLVLRKLLASSSFAIAATLERIADRLTAAPLEAVDALADDFETLPEAVEEWSEELAHPDDLASGLPHEGVGTAKPTQRELELALLSDYASLAKGIVRNAKGDALIDGLATAFERAADRKAVIFTESRRTQEYLFQLLSENGYQNEIVLMNGTNADPASRVIYENWVVRHTGSEIAMAGRAADTKAAIVEEFRDRKAILLATESAAEGINLQFCSLVVNYDLPWNPQRIEQRIGRCHRYGQKHDVVVVNLVNRANAADLRVYQLLSEKFQLFDGVFGASDEVLGALESGVDFERRIADVYQKCRTRDEIQRAFDDLQAALDDQIQARMSETRQALLENFDEEVHARMRIHKERALETLTKQQQWLVALTRQELASQAIFDEERPRFRYEGARRPIVYNLDWQDAESRGDAFYHAGSDLAMQLIGRAKERVLGVSQLHFNLQTHGTKVSALEPFVGCAGWLELGILKVESAESEEHMIFCAATDNGRELDEDLCRKLLGLEGCQKAATTSPAGLLESIREATVQSTLRSVETRNVKLYDEQAEKLDRWAEDLKSGLERELKQLDKEIKEVRRRSAQSVALAEKLQVQKEIKELDARRSKKRRDLFETQDNIERERDGLIEQVERQLKTAHSHEPLFTIRWSLE